MNSKTIKNYLAEEYTDMQNEVFKKMVKSVQKKYDKENFETKTPNDKIKCQICSGKYTRNGKSIHVKSQKHKEKEKELLEWFKEIYLHKLLITQ